MSTPTPESENRLVVVSTRLPVTLKRAGESWRVDRSAGGLATAMGPLLERTGGIWIGWSGDSSGASDDRRRAILERWAARDRFYAVDLPADTARGFYEGFSNATLWPLFHHFPTLLKFEPVAWQSYVDANRRFRDVVVEHLRPGDRVWIHDYQLMLLPRLIRDAAPDAVVGFFLHVPFPASTVYRVLPRRDELLRGLLGADLVAFHTYSYLQNFRNSLLRVLAVESRMDEVEVDGRPVSLAAMPIGIAPEEFTRLIEGDAQTKQGVAELRERYAGQRLIVAVDRLDYTKGIPERLRAFRSLLHRSPHLRGSVTLVQVAVPSREKVPMYRSLREDVDKLVGEINGELGTPSWTPVVYIRRGIPKPELAALYAAAEVAWVTPLRDGLNLVAKEYVACHPEGDGVLVLSEFAGAASEMGEAFLVNPYDEERMGETVERALALPPDERRERMEALYRRVTRNNVFAWGERFLKALSAAGARRAAQAPAHQGLFPLEEVVSAYAGAERRLLLLDYDGTLVGYASRPQDAAPPPELVELLGRLAADPANTVGVVSGRAKADLERWFAGVAGLWLFAEHGAVLRSPRTGAWELHSTLFSTDWKQRVLPVLEHYVDRTPGSFVEDKEFSLVWHYRMSDPEFGAWLANELLSTLDMMLAETELRAVPGRKTVEVRQIRANKGEVLAHLHAVCPNADFTLAAGDDRTDEDLFAILADDAWTIRIGGGASRARYRLGSPASFVAVLERLAGVAAREASARRER